jgi:DNA-binding CsgD family transcriptional regulator
MELMEINKAYRSYFERNPVLKQLLESHRDGCTRKEKAKNRNCSENTVRNQTSNILKLFGVDCMDEAVRYAEHFEVIKLVPKPEPEIRQTWTIMLAEHVYGNVYNIPRDIRKKMGIELD